MTDGRTQENERKKEKVWRRFGYIEGCERKEAERYRANQDRWSIMAATGWSDPSPTYPSSVGRVRGWFKPALRPSVVDRG